MHRGHYEYIHHPDPSFPVLFHHDIFTREQGSFLPHWHEEMELLFFTSGGGTVFIDGISFHVKAGDLAVVGFGSMHSLQDAETDTQYDCLILSPALCAPAGIQPEQLQLLPHIRDDAIFVRLAQITREFQTKAPYYKSAAKAEIISMLIYLLRHHAAGTSFSDKIPDSKTKMVKQVIEQLQRDFAQPLSLAMLAEKTGFSRYYLCHVFREITGASVSQYLNMLRCTHAQKLLLSGCSVSETSLACGFDNLSYFARMYKRCMGRTPSQDKRPPAENSAVPHDIIYYT